MARRPKIKITVTDRRGKMGCHRGHHVGEVFDYDTERGKICPMAMHCAFCCSDADTIMVFKAEIESE